MTVQATAEQMTDDEARAFAEKLEGFLAALSPKERKLFKQILAEVEFPVAVKDGEEDTAWWAGDTE